MLMVEEVCALQCHVGLPFKGKTTQDKVQYVQSQDTESRGATQKRIHASSVRKMQSEKLKTSNQIKS